MAWVACACCDSNRGDADLKVPNRIENLVDLGTDESLPVAIEPKAVAWRDSANNEDVAVTEVSGKNIAGTSTWSDVPVKAVMEEGIAGTSTWSAARKSDPTAEEAKVYPHVDQAYKQFKKDAHNTLKSDKQDKVEPKFFEWSVRLEKEGDDKMMLGLSLTLFYSRVAFVQEVLGYGLVNKFNEGSNRESDKRVKSGDALIAVNDAKGDTNEMFKAFKNSDAPILTMRRIYQFEASMSGSVEQPHGLQLKDCGTLVNFVAPGCVKEYNKTCETGFQIIRGDTVLSVNGNPEVSSELSKLSEEVSSGSVELRLLIQRNREP